ncbi:hypothetical protein [Methylomonas albis]|uniref:AbrB/MazE/SpoVT family DNA-binding domain-containing protein n=2 Tax=Methylomonas albis TaxID=1854563 RepID=A0ABR9CWI7_9GAMM|nr:AbrB/MazE/SpoVT family DNA-binding domain-containing protein [Methylomonas albis]CAD6878201.1 hypothetical protein [Methylomonas albis]
MTALTTRIFKNGNSQAVRIPQEFRLEVSEVQISRNANGDLIIHPLPLDRGAALMSALSAFDGEFADQLERDEQAMMQDRETL